MITKREQLLELAKLIREKTINGKLRWNQTSRQFAFSCFLPDGKTVIVSENQESNPSNSPLLEMDIIDPLGRSLGKIVSRHFGDEDYNSLKETYEEAKFSVEHSDSSISDVMDMLKAI